MKKLLVMNLQLFGSFADYLENALLGHVFGKTVYTAPVTLYFGLSSTTIADAGTGITEPSTGAYARVAVTNNTTNFPAPVGGSLSNGTAVTFPQASASWLAGANMVDFFIADAASSGNILAYGTLTTPKSVTTGDQLIFPIASLTFTLS
jgi:hypothetical protein